MGPSSYWSDCASKTPNNERLIASIVRGPDDGSVRLMSNVNRLRSGVCRACARTRLAVILRSALDCDASAAASRKIVGSKMREIVLTAILVCACRAVQTASSPGHAHSIAAGRSV